MTIRKATTDDLEAIHRWLEETESGFLNNWSMIEAGQAKGDVAVLLDCGDVIAFCLSSHSSMDILEVRKDRRRGSVGRQLAHHVLAEARESGSWGVSGFCEPTSSLPFWVKVGFEFVTDPSQPYMVAYPFRHKHDVPAELETCHLDFILHSPDDRPYRVKSITAAIEEDGTYSLTEDFLEYAAFGDMRLAIYRKGEVLHYGKCKNVEEIGGERQFPWVRVRSFESVLDWND